MTITITLREQRQIIQQVNLADHYDESSELMITKFNTHKSNGIEINSTVHSMPGFCLIDEQLSSQRYETVQLHVDGQCHVASFYDSGKFEINDDEQGTNDFFVAGSIKTSFSAQPNWGLSVYNHQQTHRYIIICTEDYLSKFLANEKWIPDFTVSTGQSENTVDEEIQKTAYIDAAIKNILAEISGSNYESIYRRAFMELKVKELIFLIHTQRRDDDQDSSLPPAVYQKVMRAKAFLISNYIDAPSIAQLSRIVSLNEYYLKMYFKNLFGITLHNFIIQLRMEAAEKLLQNNCPVIETSARTGYKSTSHFIAVFKKYYGKTPKQAMKKK